MSTYRITDAELAAMLETRADGWPPSRLRDEIRSGSRLVAQPPPPAHWRLHALRAALRRATAIAAVVAFG